MILGVVNGYFRTGTTLLWNLIRLSNPHALHLYEPYHPELANKLEKWTIGSRDGLHGLPLWDDYFALPKRVLTHILATIPKENVVFDYEYAIEHVKPLKSLGVCVYLQPNRVHPVLGILGAWAECSVCI